MNCPNCGLKFASRGIHIENSTGVDVGVNKETCPRCGAWAESRPGTYDFVGTVITAFREAGASRDDVARFRDIAQSVEAGEATPKQAEQEIAKLGSAYANLWQWLNANGTAIQTIVAIIAVILMVYFEQSSNADAAKLQATAEKQVEVTQKIVEELQKQNVVVPEPRTPLRPTTATPPKGQGQTQAPPTRQQRRRAEQIAKKRGR